MIQRLPKKSYLPTYLCMCPYSPPPQSLLHLQSGRDSGGRPTVKRPCCTPAAYTSLDILHLDQVRQMMIMNLRKMFSNQTKKK